MKRLILAALIGLSFNLSGHAADSNPPATRRQLPVAEVQPDGSILLKAEGARIHGFRLKLEMKPTPTIVLWTADNEYPEWPQAVEKQGTYSVEVDVFAFRREPAGDFWSRPPPTRSTPIPRKPPTGRLSKPSSSRI